MKHCANCGTQLEDAAMFCAECGQQQTAVTAPLATEAPKKKKSPLVLILVIALIVGTVLGGIGIAFGTGAFDEWFGGKKTGKTADTDVETAVSDDIAQAKEAIKNGDYKKAYTLLKESDSDEATEMLANFVFVPTRMVMNDIQRTNTFDENGNRIAFKAERPDGYVLHIKYTFDDDGVLIGEEWTETDAAPYEIRYTYSNGYLIKREDYVDGDSVGSTSFTYDESGRCLSEVHRSASGTPQKIINCTYDENGSLVVKYTEGEDGNWTRTENTYDDQQRIIRRDFAANDGYRDTTTVVYNDKEKIEYTTADNGAWAKITYTFFDNGYLKTAGYEDNTGIHNVSEYSYDEHGNLLSQDEIQKKDDKHLLRTYVYDENNNRISYSYCEDGIVIEKADWEWTAMYYPNGVPENVRELIQDALDLV